jgi:ribonuclease-3
VLELATARALYERYPDFPEGKLAKLRSHIVSRASCAVVAKELGLGERLLETGANAVSREELERLATNRNVLAALLEAALAALFLEHGFEPIEVAVVDAFQQRIDYALTDHVDYKTELQEQLARRGMHVNYVIVDVAGPAHERFFTCAALVDGQEMGRGSGAAKKTAEQSAAKEVLEKLEA